MNKNVITVKIPDCSKLDSSFMQVIFCYMIGQAAYVNNWRWWNLMIKVSVVLQNSQNENKLHNLYCCYGF